ncbi:helix-turn-helix domain-containing protein [Streptomyces sp. NPDC093982]|uniref:helix-turn-helix domain-containing protein n=1 Tax=Streptomyces sp. NPDC093982 TaxID=3155077 RepID=UPI0034155291
MSRVESVEDEAGGQGSARRALVERLLEPREGRKGHRWDRWLACPLDAAGYRRPHEAWLSLQCARLALDRRAELHLLRGAPIGQLLGRRVLGVFADLPRGRVTRLAETLDALLMSWGRTAPEVAQALGIHPQTARKRLRRLEELFGDRLADPRFRFEALLALRTHALRANAG